MKTDRLRWLVVLMILFVMSSPPAMGQEGQRTTSTKSGEDYRVGAGDLLQIVVWKNEEISGEFRVRPDGKFSMPLIGDILAGGTTTDGISMQIEQKLKLFIDSPFIATIVLEAASNRIFVLGEVVTPGTYSLEGSLTVLQALALAGGFTEFAKREKMILKRSVGDQQQHFMLSYSTILKESGQRYNMLLQRGDTLVVP